MCTAAFTAPRPASSTSALAPATVWPCGQSTFVSSRPRSAAGRVRRRVRVRVLPVMKKRRTARVDPRDEAFVTCPSCGADEPVAASQLIAAGTASVSCSQCGFEWSARVRDALTITGAPLLAERAAAAAAVGASVGDGGGDGAASAGVANAAVDADAAGIRLYVSGLGARVDSNALRAAVEEYGEVREAAVVFDRVTGRSRGFGFVTVVGRSAASAAIDELSGSTALGPRLKVREAI